MEMKALTHSASGSSRNSICLMGGPGFGNLYTRACLESYCRHAGVHITDDIDVASAIWVSMCDPDDLPTLIEARRLANGRPVIMGGFESYFGMPYLAWADAVVVGEGWEFIQAWGGDPSEALDLPCVLTRGARTVRPSYTIPWSRLPLLKVPGNERYYMLGGKGCKGKCKFCATSWTQPHQHIPLGMMTRTVEFVESRPRGKLTVISNDSGAVVESRVVNAQSVRVADYLLDPNRFKGTMLHFGVEGWTEDARRSMSKPLDDETVRQLFEVTARMKQKCELFFIVNYPGFDVSHITHFAETVIPLDVANSPAVHVKLTYFDPCPHTPWEGEMLRPCFVDTEDVFRQLNSRNKRIRVFPTRSAGRAAWRSCLHRCAPDEALLLGPQPRDTNQPGSYGAFVERLQALGLLHLIGAGKRSELWPIKVSVR